MNIKPFVPVVALGFAAGLAALGDKPVETPAPTTPVTLPSPEPSVKPLPRCVGVDKQAHTVTVWDSDVSLGCRVVLDDPVTACSVRTTDGAPVENLVAAGVLVIPSAKHGDSFVYDCK